MIAAGDDAGPGQGDRHAGDAGLARVLLPVPVRVLEHRPAGADERDFGEHVPGRLRGGAEDDVADRVGDRHVPAGRAGLVLAGLVGRRGRLGLVIVYVPAARLVNVKFPWASVVTVIGAGQVAAGEGDGHAADAGVRAVERAGVVEVEEHPAGQAAGRGGLLEHAEVDGQVALVVRRVRVVVRVLARRDARAEGDGPAPDGPAGPEGAARRPVVLLVGRAGGGRLERVGRPRARLEREQRAAGVEVARRQFDDVVPGEQVA